MMGKTTKEIFEAHGFDVTVIGMKRVEQSATRWKKDYGYGGIIGLSNSRKEASGRPLQRALSQEEIIAIQEARIHILKSQVELLKKLDTKERLLVAKGMNLRKLKLFELVKEAVDQGLEWMTGYHCSLLNVSRLEYYSYLQAAERVRSNAEAGI